MKSEVIIKFWFHDISPKSWFKKSIDFDHEIKTLFLKTYQDILAGKNVEWRATASGRLAEIIVLDQFPRNMFRDSPQAFAADPMALNLAQQAVNSGDDQKLPIEQRAFLYMPFMHSEDKKIHEKAVQLFSQKGLEKNLEYEIAHKKIIDRFGRYPHRNEILRRTSTPEELEFLKQAGSSF